MTLNYKSVDFSEKWGQVEHFILSSGKYIFAFYVGLNRCLKIVNKTQGS